jgi:hypothetical protein
MAMEINRNSKFLREAITTTATTIITPITTTATTIITPITTTSIITLLTQTTAEPNDFRIEKLIGLMCMLLYVIIQILIVVLGPKIHKFKKNKKAKNIKSTTNTINDNNNNSPTILDYII